MEIGVFLPTSAPGPGQPVAGDVRASARFAEDSGLESVWSTDHLIASAPMLDSTVALATAAAVTERLKIGYGVLLLALRPVAWAAKQISTLQQLSDGRLALGVGTGNPAHGDIGWRAAGASFEDRGRRTDEALRVLPDLVAGRASVLEDGLEVTLAPGSAMPPVLVAGTGPKAMRRAAAHGDGWIPIGLSPDEVAAGVTELAGLAAARGRTGPRATVVAPALDTDPGRAAAQLSAYAAAGAERVILAPTGAGWRPDYEFAANVRRALA
ncbi:LLM class flavin-dependent oxidoreductase [Solihabitans fulvus]|uniref:LLM class flavin-dependent oxidoreductase n=1 Tax=Solihabitans fulvus TaxID=1892852 RepID=A0A5B2WJ54_9PSEU|nr:LLM class flavin-dependent oxidoreductase [Solihabitans fulvus]